MKEVQKNLSDSIKDNIKELENKKTSWQYARAMAGGMCSLLGTLLAVYVGGWLMLLVPIKETITALMLGTLTKKLFFVTAVKCALSLTAAGAIWCAGYILDRKIAGHAEY